MARHVSVKIFVLLPIWFLMLSCQTSNATLTCFSCGYLKDADGNIGPIVEVEFAIPFCNGSDSTYWPTEKIEGDGCCASYKGVITEQYKSNVGLGPLPHTIVRHGTNKDGDEFAFRNFTCTETSDDECKHEILKFENGELEDAVVCHCTENLCNYRTPVVPGTSTERSKTTNDKNGANVRSTFYGLLFHILFWAGMLAIF